MLLHVMKSVEEAFLLALELEPSFRAPLDRRLTSIARKRFSRCHHAYQCLIKCPECDGIGHYDFQWPTKSLHTETVHINDIDHSRINEDVFILNEGTNDLDKLLESIASVVDEI